MQVIHSFISFNFKVLPFYQGQQAFVFPPRINLKVFVVNLQVVIWS